MHRTASVAARNSSCPRSAGPGYDQTVSVPFNTEQFQALPTRRIPLDDVRPSQLYVDEAKVDRMRRTWSSDMALPVVADRGGRFTVLDGHHRVAAARARGHKYLRARISQ